MSEFFHLGGNNHVNLSNMTIVADHDKQVGFSKPGLVYILFTDGKCVSIGIGSDAHKRLIEYLSARESGCARGEEEM